MTREALIAALQRAAAQGDAKAAGLLRWMDRTEKNGDSE